MYADVTLEEYHYIVAVYDYDMNQGRVYIDNVEVQTKDYSERQLGSDLDLRIGGADDFHFSGDMSCLVIYDRALTVEEIAELAPCNVAEITGGIASLVCV